MELKDQMERINQGAEMLVALTRGRLHEALEALERGEFDAAEDRISEAAAKLVPLATAERQIGGLAGTMILRVERLQEGMTITGWGGVSSVAPVEQPCAHGHVHSMIAVTLESGEVHVLPGEREIIVEGSGRPQ